jgi:AcrR family transcriptional regulator
MATKRQGTCASYFMTVPKEVGMRLFGKTFIELIILYSKHKNPENVPTAVSANTTHTIIDAFISLLREKPIDKILVKDIVARSGYSRTTFYQHFYDVRDVYETLEDMIMFHLEKNAENYLRYFQNRMSEEEHQQTNDMVAHYEKYTVSMNQSIPGFEARYKQGFILIINALQDEENQSGDDLKQFQRRVAAAALAEGYFYTIGKNPDKLKKIHAAMGQRVINMLANEVSETYDLH